MADSDRWLPRFIVATCVASLVIDLTIGSVGFLFNPDISVLDWDHFTHGMFFFSVVGWPIALLVAFAFGLPVVLFLRHRQLTLTRSLIVTVSTVVGAMSLPLMFWPSLEFVTAGIGALGGFAGGVAFWIVHRSLARTPANARAAA